MTGYAQETNRNVRHIIDMWIIGIDDVLTYVQVLLHNNQLLKPITGVSRDVAQQRKQISISDLFLYLPKPKLIYKKEPGERRR